MTPKEISSALSLAAITAGAVGAILLILSISSIAAIISMGATVKDNAPVETEAITVDVEDSVIDDKTPEAKQEYFLEHAMRMFDTWYQNNSTRSPANPS